MSYSTPKETAPKFNKFVDCFEESEFIALILYLVSTLSFHTVMENGYLWEFRFVCKNV